jgi:hypothetical protein
MSETPSSGRSIFDFFISYKQRDSSDFANALASELHGRQYTVWLDSDQMHPGESILKSIENGLNDSIDAILIFSQNYFGGWSEQERRTIFHLMVSGKIRYVPIYYQITLEEVRRLAPMGTDILGISAANSEQPGIETVCDKLSRSFRPEQRRSRLFEMFFKCVSNHFPDDNDIKMWIALFENNIDSLKHALDGGADPNITDSALWNRYNKSALECCFPEWRKLFLYLSQIGAIGSLKSTQNGSGTGRTT